MKNSIKNNMDLIEGILWVLLIPAIGLNLHWLYSSFMEVVIMGSCWLYSVK